MTDIILKNSLPGVILTETEHATHDGIMYHVSQYDLSQSTTNTIQFVFKTPETDHVHLWISWSSLTGGHLTLNEGVTWSHDDTNQTTMNIICNRRDAPRTSQMQDKSAQTDWNVGGVMTYQAQSLVNTTEIAREYIFGDWSAALPMKNEDYYILALDTLYSIILTTDAKASKSYLKMRWTENRITE